MKTFALIIIYLLAINTASAQNDYPPMVALDNTGQLWLYGYTEAPEQIEIEGSSQLPLLSAMWSPNGQKLALSVRFGEGSRLLLIEPPETDYIILANNVALDLPATFSADGQYVLYAVNSPYQSEERDVYQIASQGNANPELLGSIHFIGACGGGPSHPANFLYDIESGVDRTTDSRYFDHFPFILNETPYGIVHTSSCTGSDIRLLSSVTGEDIGLPDDQTRTVISLDRSLSAGIHGTEIIITDMETLTSSRIMPEMKPELLSWSMNGNLFYSTRTETTNLLETLTSSQRDAVFSALREQPTSLPAYQVGIRYLNVPNGSEEVIYENNAYEIGRLMPDLEGGEIYFSEIPNLDEWINTAIDGRIEGSPNFYEFWRWFSPLQTSLYKLNLATREVELLGTGLNQATINFASISNH